MSLLFLEPGGERVRELPSYRLLGWAFLIIWAVAALWVGIVWA